MDTAQTDRFETDRFTRLMIFNSNHNFPIFAADMAINYKVVIGYYKGIIEESYVVNMRNIPAILESGMLRGQESVLWLTAQEAVYGGQRKVYLVKVNDDEHSLDPNGEFIGKWHKVSTAEALHSDAWTCDTTNNTWYVAKMPTPDL